MGDVATALCAVCHLCLCSRDPIGSHHLLAEYTGEFVLAGQDIYQVRSERRETTEPLEDRTAENLV